MSQAGQPGAVTISTNMAGRGTDIKLGPGVAELGGLHILGTERHESRRIDNQLRGRSGRQGDRGSSRFYLSLEDDLLRIFGAERISSVMDKIGLEEGEPIEHRLISRAIENAQKRVEAQNFDIRKHLLEYDDVMNQQREVIYRQRKEVLGGDNLSSALGEMLEDVVDTVLEEFADENVPPDAWNLKGLDERLFQLFSLKTNFQDMEDGTPAGGESLREWILEAVRTLLRQKRRNWELPSWKKSRRFSCSSPSTPTGKTTFSAWTISERESA